MRNRGQVPGLRSSEESNETDLDQLKSLEYNLEAFSDIWDRCNGVVVNQRCKPEKVPERVGGWTIPAEDASTATEILTEEDIQTGRPMERDSATDTPKFSWCEGKQKRSAVANAASFMGPDKWPVQVMLLEIERDSIKVDRVRRYDVSTGPARTK